MADFAGNTHVSIDLETFGKGSNAVIVSLGAAKFEPFTGEVIDTFYNPIDPGTCMAYGMQADGDTLLWWMQQSEEARTALLHGAHIQLTLVAFSDWLTGGDDSASLPDKSLAVYGNGSKFDLTILENAYKATGLAVPWAYKKELCGRTLRELGRITGVDLLSRAPESTADAVEHNAKDDAAWLAGQISSVFQTVRHLAGHQHGR